MVVEYVVREREGSFLAICFISKAYSFQPDFYGVNHPQVFFFFLEQISGFVYVVKYL